MAQKEMKGNHTMLAFSGKDRGAFNLNILSENVVTEKSTPT